MCVSVLYFQSSQQTECPSPSHCCGSISKCFEPERHKISGCCTGSLSTRKCKLLKWREQLTKSYKEQEARRSKQTYFILLWQRFYKSYYSGWSAASVTLLSGAFTQTCSAQRRWLFYSSCLQLILSQFYICAFCFPFVILPSRQK